MSSATNSPASIEELLAPPGSARKSLLRGLTAPVAGCSIAVQEPPADNVVVKLNVIQARSGPESSRLGRPKKHRSRSGAPGSPIRKKAAPNGTGLRAPLPQRHQGEPVEDQGLWNVKAVCEYMKCSKSWVYKAAESGVLPCIRIGSMLRFRPADIRAFVFADGN